MAHFLSCAAHASVVLLEVIALVWIGKKALELATRTRFREELMVKDNSAAHEVRGSRGPLKNSLWILVLAACSSPVARDDQQLKAWEERFRQDDEWERRLGGRLEAEGTAERTKLGTMVGQVGIDGSIPEGL